MKEDIIALCCILLAWGAFGFVLETLDTPGQKQETIEQKRERFTTQQIFFML